MGKQHVCGWVAGLLKASDTRLRLVEVPSSYCRENAALEEKKTHYNKVRAAGFLHMHVAHPDTDTSPPVSSLKLLGLISG